MRAVGCDDLASRLAARYWDLDDPARARNLAAILGGELTRVVIHPEAQIGPNCLLFQQVTVGTGPKPGAPRIGGHVDVGAGAKILGGVVIGDHAVIGANAVVVTDVPAGGVAVGIPAVVKRRVADFFNDAPPSSPKRMV